MEKIFISYRRSESQYVVGRIYEELCSKFGKENVFKDIDSIPLGTDFRTVISDVVNSCDVLIAIIGKQWSTSSDGDGKPRLHDPDDFVRIEIESALQRNIPVIPVLINEADISHVNDLPGSIKNLTYRNALSIRPDPDFKTDIKKLLTSISEINEKSRIISKKYIYVGVSLLLLIASLLLLYFNLSKDSDSINNKNLNADANSSKHVFCILNKTNRDVEFDYSWGGGKNNNWHSDIIQENSTKRYSSNVNENMIIKTPSYSDGGRNHNQKRAVLKNSISVNKSCNKNNTYIFTYENGIAVISNN